MAKVRDVYNKKNLSNKIYLKKQLYALRMKEGTLVLKLLNFFNKVIRELLAVDVKIDEEGKASILLSSLLQSYDHIITIMLYGKCNAPIPRVRRRYCDVYTQVRNTLAYIR